MQQKYNTKKASINKNARKRLKKYCDVFFSKDKLI